jgi:hypothetical protein
MLFSIRVVLAVTVAMLCAVPLSAQQYFHAAIEGTREVPPSGSLATGLGCFTLNPDSTLDYQVSYAGLSGLETAAHIHGPAPAGVNAGVVFPFALGTPKVGTFGPSWSCTTGNARMKSLDQYNA